MDYLVTSDWFVVPKPNPEASCRLFCFPYAGAGPSIFRNWPHFFRSGIEIFIAQLPGRGKRVQEPPITELPILIDAIMEGILPLLDRPFAFFGHSMGALLSFELARKLRKENAPQPFHLFVSGRRAPQLPYKGLRTFELPDPEFIESLRRLNGTPKELLENTSVIQAVIPVLRADFALCQTYTYYDENPLEYLISAFGGLNDVHVLRAELEAWSVQTSASFVVRMLPGDHFFLHISEFMLLQSLLKELYANSKGLARSW
jgi:medium-chain acyl-[acyl-carrier-protein] hydrolase